MQSLQGKIISAKANKTVTVSVDYYKRHPKYKKSMKKTTKILAHSEIEDLKEGDLVAIVKSRPYSKRKHFRVVKKI